MDLSDVKRCEYCGLSCRKDSYHPSGAYPQYQIPEMKWSPNVNLTLYEFAHYDCVPCKRCKKAVRGKVLVNGNHKRCENSETVHFENNGTMFEIPLMTRNDLDSTW